MASHILYSPECLEEDFRKFIQETSKDRLLQGCAYRAAEGTRLDAVVTSVPATECGGNCLELSTVADGDYDWVVYEEERLRFVVLKNVAGERVTIAVEAPAADFEGFLP